MKKATLRILNQPHLGQGAQRFEVDCRHSTTGLMLIPVPGGVNPDRSTLITAAAYSHEERCGRCDVSEVLDQGDQNIRQITERAWAEFQRQAMQERAN